MSWRHSSLIVLVLLALLVAACGPLPTDSAPAAEMDTPTDAPAATEQIGDTPAPATSVPEGPAPTPGELVNEEDYHVLGAPDASVTIIEYSDFQ